jgi:hypothetical protein
MKRRAASHPALVFLLAWLLAAPAPLHAQTTPPRDQDGPSEREPTMRELGAMMGQMMGQMGEMMGDMAQNMGSTMQRMMERMQKEGSLRDPKNEHIEGKLAFLKAELQITSSQENAWAGFADAMRKAAAMKPPGREGGATLPERMEDQTRMLQHRLAVMQAKKTAIDKLYAQLDARQKGLADDLIEQIGLV